MKLKLTTRSIRLLETFVEHAHAMPLGKAYNYVKEHQDMDNDLAKYEHIICKLLEALGVNSNGHLGNKVILEQIKDCDLEVWQAIQMSGIVHYGYNYGLKGQDSKPYGASSLNRDELNRVKLFRQGYLDELKEE